LNQLRPLQHPQMLRDRSQRYPVGLRDFTHRPLHPRQLLQNPPPRRVR
jgi:hypothetical protein